MKFIPIPQKCNKNEFTEDLSEFSRKVRLLEYFEDSEDRDNSLVRNTSYFMHPKYRNSDLESYAQILENYPISVNNKKSYNVLKRDNGCCCMGILRTKYET